MSGIGLAAHRAMGDKRRYTWPSAKADPCVARQRHGTTRGDQKLHRVRFDEWADAFEDGLVRLAPTTARRYRQLLTLQIRPWFEGRPIVGIDYQDIESFIVDLHRRGYSAKTVRDCVSVLSLVMKAALRAKVIRENPAAGHHVKVARQRGRRGHVPAAHPRARHGQRRRSRSTACHPESPEVD
jgi:hypothetical protein